MRYRSGAAVTALLLTLMGCARGSSTPASPSSASSQSGFPITLTDDDGVKVTIDHQPQRIVTFAPSMTEIVFALGLGSELVGVSGPSDDYPPQAQSIEEIGGAGDSGVEPNIERVVALRPDLFLTISGGDQWKQRLRDLGVPVVTLDASSLDDLFGDIGTVGRVTGATRAAADLVGQMTDEATSIEQRAVMEPPVSCFFEVYDPPLLTVGPDTFIFDLLRLAGCDPVTASARTVYPEWSVDDLVRTSPDVYIATGESAKSVAAIQHRPGFRAISAVATGNVAIVDADLVTRPGPRVVDGLEELLQALHPGA